MLILNDVRLLHQRRYDFSYPEYLKELLRYIHELQYQDGAFIIEFCQYLREQITEYAITHSPVYKTKLAVSKADLADKKQWYTNGWSASAAKTGGSTTGEPFHYRRWADTYFQIEGDNHYRTILREFGLDRPLDIVYLMLDQHDDRTTNNLVRVYNTNNILISHGLRHQATVHDIIKNKAYYNDYFAFYDRLIEYLSGLEIDVILAPGNTIAELTWNIRRLHHTAPICKLLSSTGAKTQRSDLDFLTQNGNIETWCDHMRCWDGGATFFTCKHHTYHLVDGLSWVTSPDGKLVTDDYYSLPAPFVNYWNGDYATVGETYKKCKCGRSYRNFSIDRTRTFAVNGMNHIEVSKALLPMTDVIALMKRISHSDNFLRIFTHSPMANSDRQRIRQALPSFEINFVTESIDG